MLLCEGAGHSPERYTQAGSRGAGSEQGTIGRDHQWFRRHRLRVVFTDLSQRIVRYLPAEIRLTVHHTRQSRLRRAC